MSARNRTSVGFLTITLLHLGILGMGVLLQDLYERWVGPATFKLLLGLIVGGWCGAVLVWRAFFWEVFRSLKSSAVLLTLLVVSCILGTLFIQDLDLRRAGVTEEGLAPNGELPTFDSRNKSTRFALAEAHGWLKLFPNEERGRLMELKARLSDFQKAQVELRSEAFGQRAADALEKALLASRRRQVEELTTSNFARQHHVGLYRFYKACRLLRLSDIFEAWWFYGLLFLIAVNVIVGTIARAPWSGRDFGIAITHAGVLIILTGALLDVLMAKEGYIHFVYGKPSQQVASKIYDQKDRSEHRLPFRVHLDRFATEYFHELLVERVDWSRRHDGSPRVRDRSTPFSAWNRYAVRTGVPRVFEGGKITAKILDYRPRVFVDTKVEDDPTGPLDPAAKIALYNRPQGGPNLLVAGNVEPWVYANDPQQRALDLGDVLIEYEYATSPAELKAALERSAVPDNGTLLLRLGDRTARMPILLGASREIQVGERKVSIEFLKIASQLSDSKNVNLDSTKQRTEVPVLYLRLDGKEIFVPRDDREFISGFKILDGLKLRFDWPDPRDRGVFNIYRVVESAGGQRHLVQAEGDRTMSSPIRSRMPVPLKGKLEGYFLGVARSVRSATRKRAITDVSDEEFLEQGGGGRDHLLAAWARVEVDGPWGRKQFELTPGDGRVRYGDDGQGRPLYAFSLPRTEMARDWFSVLSVIGADGTAIKTHAVQVNSPLRHRGYRFFQATAGKDSQGLGVSGISVTKNPGVSFMYLGYTVLTLGVCYVFFIRPVIDGRRRRRRRVAEGVRS